jgi:three-Cys-motif partner protein
MSDVGDDDLDEIGEWSLRKHEILEYYATTYSRIMTNAKARFTTIYIDAYANRGKAKLKGTAEIVLGSALRMLQIEPPFDKYVFIEIDGNRAASLRMNVAGRGNVEVIVGDANAVIPAKLDHLVAFERFERGLLFLDPHNMRGLRWETIAAAGHNSAVDAIIFFPTMDAHRSVLPKDPANVRATMVAKMRLFWGDDNWYPTAYNSAGLLDFGDGMIAKQDVRVLLGAFATRLRDVAGFQFVSRPIPVRNRSNNILYHLFFAAHNVAAKRVMSALEKHFGAERT